MKPFTFKHAILEKGSKQLAPFSNHKSGPAKNACNSQAIFNTHTTRTQPVVKLMNPQRQIVGEVAKKALNGTVLAMGPVQARMSITGGVLGSNQSERVHTGPPIYRPQMGQKWVQPKAGNSSARVGSGIVQRRKLALGHPHYGDNCSICLNPVLGYEDLLECHTCNQIIHRACWFNALALGHMQCPQCGVAGAWWHWNGQSDGIGGNPAY